MTDVSELHAQIAIAARIERLLRERWWYAALGVVAGSFVGAVIAWTLG